MPAANDEMDKTAAALYAQIQKELDQLLDEIDEQEYRLPELERIARIYALVAHSPAHQGQFPSHQV
jgi:hypothetical protein